jgi:hypothetical protein
LSFLEDKYQRLAVKDLRAFFNTEENKSKVFYSRQLEVIFEQKYYHWITNRSIRELIDSGEILSEQYNLNNAGTVNLLWLKSFRYYKRAAKEVVDIIDEYSNPNLSADIGLRGEMLVLEGFAMNGFQLREREANSFNGMKWQKSEHNIDFIFSKDGIDYGIEVKNMLGYMDYKELEIKIEMCDTLSLKPVFAVRMFPKTWINEIKEYGGFSLIMRYQFYPLSYKNLAEKIRRNLNLPVETPRRLEQGTMERINNWHKNNVNLK